MQLFKEEVYKKLEEKLKQPSDHNGIEDALRMINADKRLQNFLFRYAKKSGLKYDAFGHPFYSNKEEITFWEGKTKYMVDTDIPNKLYLCPNINDTITPILIRTRSPTSSIFIDLVTEEKTDGFYINDKKYNSRYNGARLIHTRLLPENLTAKQIFCGLEKSILNLSEQNET